MALRCFIAISCSRVQDDVILPRVGELRFFEAPGSRSGYRAVPGGVSGTGKSSPDSL
jgi:hypothetical protein